MDTIGTHLLVDLRGCDSSRLNNVDNIEQSMRAAALAANATVVSSQFHQFGPHGVSGVLVLAESHLSVHTWPEHQYAAVDIYTCGESCTPERAHELLHRALQATSIEVLEVRRGNPIGMDATNSQGIVVGRHSQSPSTILGEESGQPRQGIDRSRSRPE